ncbi:MAG: 6-phosphofructokinase [Oscillospiraceae bacterium]
MEINKDARIDDNGMITVVQIMGCHAGWLAASAALATEFGSGPDLIYLPELDFDMDKFLADVDKVYKANGKVLGAVSEGILMTPTAALYLRPRPLPPTVLAMPSWAVLVPMLAEIVKNHTGAEGPCIELSLLQRCGAHLASKPDIDEAFGAGQEAVKQAVAGTTGKMVAFEREYIDGKYHCKITLIPLSSVANYEKKVPLEWRNAEGNGLKHERIDYVLPLIQGEPELPSGVFPAQIRKAQKSPCQIRRLRSKKSAKKCRDKMSRTFLLQLFYLILYRHSYGFRKFVQRPYARKISAATTAWLPEGPRHRR